MAFIGRSGSSSVPLQISWFVMSSVVVQRDLKTWPVLYLGTPLVSSINAPSVGFYLWVGDRGGRGRGKLCFYSLSYMGMKLPIGPCWSIVVFFDQKRRWTRLTFGLEMYLAGGEGRVGAIWGTIWHSALNVHAVYTSCVRLRVSLRHSL